MKALFCLAIALASCSALAESETTSVEAWPLDNCDSAADCSFIPTTACSRPACFGGVCVQFNTPNGEPADTPQHHGDCKTFVCWNLAVIAVAEPHDPPFLPGPCVTSYCRGAVPVIVKRDCW